MCFMDHKSQSISDSIPNKMTEGKPAKPKEKRRNNEKRKEKSRDAARCRRSRETEIFSELGDTLPIRKDELENLDKASVMRLAIVTLKIENMLQLFKFDDTANESTIESQIVSQFEENAITKALDGFFIALSAEGDVTYVSENIHEYIGIQQIDIIGNQIWDYTHQCDHLELREILNSRRLETVHSDKELENIENAQRNVLIRIKCTLTSRGRNVNIKSASYKVINIVGHTVVDTEQNHHQFIGIARLVPHPSNIEIPLDSKTFLSKHSLNMKFSYVDDKMLPILGYKPTDLLDKSLYEYHHGADSEALMAAFKNVINKGQTETPQYRFLGRNGGYCWVISQATLVYDKQKPQSVVCVNYVISELTNENEIYSSRQLDAYNALPQNEKVKIKNRAEKNKITDGVSFKIKDVDGISISNITGTAENSSLSQLIDQKDIDYKLTDNSVRHVLIANQFNSTAISKANPKAVTASVFKSLPSASIKHKLNTSNNVESLLSNKNIETSQRLVAVPLMKTTIAETRDSFNSLSTISEPSILPRQTVVTATLFQPLRAPKEIGSSNTLTANKTDLRTGETMNRSFCISNDDLCQTILLKAEPDEKVVQSVSPSANSAPTMTHKISNSATNFATNNKLIAANNLSDNSFIPLEESTPLFGEIFNELILPDNYCTLLSDEMQSPDSQSNKINIVDDIINYSDIANGVNDRSPNLSSNNLSKSPEGSSSLPSLCSPNSMGRNDEFAFVSTSLDNTDIDLSMRAPYIPMNENDDLPLLTEDLMWSAFSDEVSLHKDIRTASDLQLQNAQTQHFGSDSVEQMLINDVHKSDVRYVSPPLTTYINIENDNISSNDGEIQSKLLKIEQNQNNFAIKSADKINLTCDDIIMNDALMKNKALLNDTAVHKEESKMTNNLSKVQKPCTNQDGLTTYTVQKPKDDVYIKNGEDSIFLEWHVNDPSQIKLSDAQANLDCQTNPSMVKHLIFTSEKHRLQVEKSESNNINVNHKRCSTYETSVNKRLKSSTDSNYNLHVLNSNENIQNRDQQMVILQKSHLLQQLMAPTPQKINKNFRSKSRIINQNINEGGQWINNVGCERIGHQPSESVLKNLLNENGTFKLPNKLIEHKLEDPKVSLKEHADPYYIKDDSDPINMDSNIYGLVEDIFLVNDLNSGFLDPVEGDVPLIFPREDETNGVVSSAICEKKPSESFEKQITISVPQPPPLKAEAFTIGGGLFHGITDHTDILPTSLISPMDDMMRLDTENLMDIWTNEIE